MKPAKKIDNKKAPHPQKPAGKAKPAFSNQLLIWNGVILAIAIIAFSPGLTGNFLSWDDYNYITENPLIRKFTWENIMHVFNYKTIVVGNYHPLTVLSYMIEYQLVGLKPFLYHFDNLLLHLFNIILFSRLMWMLTRKNYATIIATALFAVHPMRVESVVWAAERKDVLYTFFFLLALISYLYFLLQERKNNQYYFLSIVFFILSVLSKGQAVVLPLTLFLVDFWYDKKLTLSSILNKVPYFVISLISGILAIIAQHTSLTEQRLVAHSFLDRIAISGFNITAYLYKLVFPFNLSAFYKYPAPDNMLWIYVGCLAAILIIGVSAFFFRKNKPVVFGSLFFLFTISIVTQILPVGNAIIADRYTYIPYIGLFFIIGVLLDQLITGKTRNARYYLAIHILLFVVFSIKTYAQSRIWHDNASLWENALRQDPDNGVASTNLGKHYADMEDYQTSIAMLEKAVQNKAAYADLFQAYFNLGSTCAKVGKNEEALKSFTMAHSLKPAMVEAIFGRGLAYTSLTRYDSAIIDFTTIISKLNPVHIQSYYSRGVAWNKMNMPDSAIVDYSSAIRINPNYGDAFTNRGNIYFARNQFDAALADYTASLRIAPEGGKVYLNRSFVYFKLQRYKEALDDALKAQSLQINVSSGYLSDLKNLVKP